MENKLVPKIRFSGFTDAWEQRKLGEICSEFKSGNAITSKEITENGIYPVYGGNGLRGYTDIHTHDGKYVLIGRQGALCGNINYVTGKTYISEHAIVIGENELSSIRWLEQLLTKMNLNVYSESSAQPGLSVEKLKKLIIYIPSKGEQTVIGNFFCTLDDTITLHQRKLDMLKKMKRAYLQQMFPQNDEDVPRLRFADFEGEWEQRKLGELVDTVKSYSLSRDVETSEHTGFRYVHYGDIHKKIADLIKDDNKLPLIKAGEYELLQSGDVIVADASEDYIGIAEPSIILENSRDKIVAGLHTIAMRPKKIDSQFLYYLLHTNRFKKFGNKVGTGMKVFGITTNNLYKFIVLFPDIKEQAKIGAFFKHLDDNITSNQTKLDRLKLIKNAYLQNIFI